MIEWILQTNSTVTTTVTSTQTSLIDLSLVVSLLIAVSGIVALIFTYLRISESREERRQHAYRELIMTPQFLKLFSAFDVMRQTLKGISAAQRGESGSLTIAGEHVEFKDKKGFDEEMRRIAPKLLPVLIETQDSLGQSGLRDLVPTKISTMFIEAMKSAIDSLESRSDFNAADKKFDEMYVEIRKMLGVE